MFLGVCVGCGSSVTPLSLHMHVSASPLQLIVLDAPVSTSQAKLLQSFSPSPYSPSFSHLSLCQVVFAIFMNYIHMNSPLLEHSHQR